MNYILKKIIKKLKKKKLTISVAESCTGGLLSFLLTKTPGASKIYSCGLVTYSNKSKNNLLKVSKNLINKYGTVSKQVCVSMLENLNKITNTDISVSITGIAGPDGGTIIKPVGLVFIGIKFKKRKVCKKFIIKKKNRNFIQKESVKKALIMINKLI